MQIAWTNMDDVDRLLIIERVDEQGVVMDSGGTSLLQPGTTFMITLTEEGQYTYYCSIDRKEFGTINVVPNVSVSTNAHVTSESSTPECVENVILPTIIEIQPAWPSAGSEVTIIGSGGFVRDSCGGVNESARSFPLYLDNEPAADLQCYVSHCEAKLRLGDTLADGAHCLSMQKDVCEFEFRIAGQIPATLPASPTPLLFTDPSISLSERIVCYYFVTPAENPAPEGSVMISSTYILAPTFSDIAYSTDTADNLTTALAAVLNDGRNGWISNKLEIVNVTFGDGRADIVLQGEYFGAGDVTLIAASMQILMTVFANPSVQTATVTLNGDTIGNLGVSNSINAKPAEYVFTRAEIETFRHEHAYVSP